MDLYQWWIWIIMSRLWWLWSLNHLYLLMILLIKKLIVHIRLSTTPTCMLNTNTKPNKNTLPCQSIWKTKILQIITLIILIGVKKSIRLIWGNLIHRCLRARTKNTLCLDKCSQLRIQAVWDKPQTWPERLIKTRYKSACNWWTKCKGKLKSTSSTLRKQMSSKMPTTSC